MAITDFKLARRRAPEIIYRPPSTEDGANIWRLIDSCETLDENSLYCNLLQCDHFADTCVAAERADNGALAGWVSGYLLPDTENTLFVWQVAVDKSVQGMGVGKKLLSALLERDACQDVSRLKTTITSDNEASWALFSSLARAHGGRLSHKPHFRKDAHFDGRHATEHMVTIDFTENAGCLDGVWLATRNGRQARGGDTA